MHTALLCFALTTNSHLTWSDYGGAADSAQYSALKQVDRRNVAQLKVAWTYPTEDGKHYAFNPLVIDGVMYVLAHDDAIVALNAATGREIWRHNAEPETKIITDRGINYWESADRADRRLLFAANHMLQAIDARTGKTIDSFGIHGRVDLKEGLGRDPRSISLVQSTTPGRVFEDLLILGSATNQGWGSAPGDIRAFDVRTGALRWTFHTIPHEGEFGYDTWPKDAWKSVGGANAWSELTLDETRGIVYIPTASPKYNFYGADRLGANLFGDCLLALDARTGKRLWHFQMVHHDIWDYDDATAPKLLTVQHEGKPVDVVAQVSKQGFVWVFNRVTGEPLWPIEERAVPKSDMSGEQAWPTQPFPTIPPPFARQKFTADDLDPAIGPEERARIKDEIDSARNEGLFTPPGLRGTIQMPGNNGGANWGGAAVDPANGSLFVISKDLPCLLKLVPSPKAGPDRYESGFGFMLTSKGVSPIAPPWTSLTAYDLNAGTIKWQVPLGNAHRTKSGPVVTGGGLIFTGTSDKMVRAYNEETGKMVWELELSTPVAGIPAVYEVAGREYIVFCAGDSYLAFALPRSPN
jgi:quinoprotein glucose dehydrogenase